MSLPRPTRRARPGPTPSGTGIPRTRPHAPFQPLTTLGRADLLLARLDGARLELQSALVAASHNVSAPRPTTRARSESRSRTGYLRRIQHLFHIYRLPIALLLAVSPFIYGKWQPASNVVPAVPDYTSCLVAPSGEDIIPDGIRAPLASMAFTLASSPDYTKLWIPDRMPFAEVALPVIHRMPNSIEFQWLEHAERKMRSAAFRALNGDYGAAIDEPGAPSFLGWSKRINRIPSQIAPIWSAVARAQSSRSRPFWKNVWVHVRCWGYSTGQDEDCVALAQRERPAAAWNLARSMVDVVFTSCWHPNGTLSSDSAASALSTQNMRRQIQGMQQTIMLTLARLAHQESANIRNNFSKAGADIEDFNVTAHLLAPAPQSVAPWAAADRSMTRNMQPHFLSQPWIMHVNGKTLQIPSVLTQRRLHAMSALLAHSVWLDMLAVAFEAVHTRVHSECSTAVGRADLNSLMNTWANRSATDDAGQLAEQILNMTASMILDDDSEDVLPLFDCRRRGQGGDCVVEEEVVVPGYMLKFGRGKPDINERQSRDQLDHVPRTPWEQVWRRVIMQALKQYGEQRRPSSPIHACLFRNITTVPTTAFATSAYAHHHAATSASIEASVYEFFAKGASPLWRTWQVPHWASAINDKKGFERARMAEEQRLREAEDPDVKAAEDQWWADMQGAGLGPEYYGERYRVTTPPIESFEGWSRQVDLDEMLGWGK